MKKRKTGGRKKARTKKKKKRKREDIDRRENEGISEGMHSMKKEKTLTE